MTTETDFLTRDIPGPRPYGRAVFAVAPMIDWTDRHCRFFHRQLSGQALLYTEMVVADAAFAYEAVPLLDLAGFVAQAQTDTKAQPLPAQASVKLFLYDMIQSAHAAEQGSGALFAAEGDTLRAPEPQHLGYHVDLLAEHLLQRGYRHIAFAAAQLDPRTLQRAEGYRRCLRNAGLYDAKLEVLSPEPSSIRLGAELLEEVLRTRPGVDAVF